MLIPQAYPPPSKPKSEGSSVTPANVLDREPPGGAPRSSLVSSALASPAPAMASPLARPAEGFPFLSPEMPELRILVVDDDASLRNACCEIASGMGFVALAAGSVPEALTILEEQEPVDMLLLDLKLPGGGGLNLLGQVKARYPRTGVVVMTAFATVSSAVEAMRIGAGD